MGPCARTMAKLLGAGCEGPRLSGRVAQIHFLPCTLFDGLGTSDRFFDRIDAMKLPEGFEPIAVTDDDLAPAFACVAKNLYGLQFYAESNDPDGAQILANFAGQICNCSAYWSSEFYVEREIGYLRERIGDGRAITAISGGVDSTVCAVLMHRAIGERLKCVFVDTGLLRKGEAETVRHVFREHLGLEPVVIDARSQMLSALAGVTDGQEKRRVVKEVFVQALRGAAEPGVEFLAEGTIYPDLLSGEGERPAALEGLKRIEPIRMLFKDEVRAIGEFLGVPRDLLARQPFPGPGLAVRCIGEVTEEKLALLRDADAIFRAEIVEAGLDRKLTHYFAILTGHPRAGPPRRPRRSRLRLRAARNQRAGRGECLHRQAALRLDRARRAAHHLADPGDQPRALRRYRQAGRVGGMGIINRQRGFNDDSQTRKGAGRRPAG